MMAQLCTALQERRKKYTTCPKPKRACRQTARRTAVFLVVFVVVVSTPILRLIASFTMDGRLGSPGRWLDGLVKPSKRFHPRFSSVAASSAPRPPRRIHSFKGPDISPRMAFP